MRGHAPRLHRADAMSKSRVRQACITPCEVAAGCDDPRQAASVTSKVGQSPLHLAAARGCGKCVALLHSAAPEMVTHKDKRDQMPAAIAARRGHAVCHHRVCISMVCWGQPCSVDCAVRCPQPTESALQDLSRSACCPQEIAKALASASGGLDLDMPLPQPAQPATRIFAPAECR